MFAWWVGCDLPTEAEWEFAARGRPSDDEALSDLEQVPMYAWYGENSENRTHPVGLRSPNSRGLYDLLGNLREWCGDWYSETYYAECLESGGPVIDPGGPESGERRVLRGGTFDWAKWNLRPTYRNFNTPDNRSHVTGFRLVVRAGLSGWAELPRPPS
jgi:formylglycine-generating enzyme required for sulfatase activity